MEKRSMKHAVIGLLAHVDAGKTTLSEAMLFHSGMIRKPGRVDKRNTILDYNEIERERGITVFSKQVILHLPQCEVTLVDTPGHVDFSQEAERVFPILDYAILVVSGSEGVQPHTETLCDLLREYAIPIYIFVTKTDMSFFDPEKIKKNLKRTFGDACVEIRADTDCFEKIALTDENAMEEYLATGRIQDETVYSLISQRKLVPCFFGSGLTGEGVDDFLSFLEKSVIQKDYSATFSAIVYKIGYDKTGKRLTFLKLTGGELRARQIVSYSVRGEPFEEKITEIRLYSGEKFESVEILPAGRICAVTGLSAAFPGLGLGETETDLRRSLSPILSCTLRFPKETSLISILPNLKKIEEEEPSYRIVPDFNANEIRVSLMGSVQSEVLLHTIFERCSVLPTICDRRTEYRETITASAEGVGHFEPLRHYAEVHLLLRPLSPGSGIVIDSEISSDDPVFPWRKAILNYLEETVHPGVLGGFPLTDTRITVLCGKSHPKHTQGPDFRESTSRALRMALMTLAAAGCCRLLEPYSEFRLEVPSESTGRAVGDIVSFSGGYSVAESDGETTVLVGKAPSSCLDSYGKEIAAYTHGLGKITLRPSGWMPVRNQEKILETIDYDPFSDPEHTPDSVFCSHGSGFIVPWNHVPEYMHLSFCTSKSITGATEIAKPVERKQKDIDERELEAIMEREFGPIRRKRYGEARVIEGRDHAKTTAKKEDFLIIDGYNLIFAWDELKRAADADLSDSRDALLRILENYASFSGKKILVVFDAYRTGNREESVEEKNGITVVFTKAQESADTYIERLTAEIGKNYSVKVVSSDGLIQLQAFRVGVLRYSAREFVRDLIETDEQIRAFLKKLEKTER